MQGTGYTCPTLSRDGSLLVVSSDDERNGKHFIHLYDFARDTSTSITEGGSDNFPVLSPDGKTVAYSSAMPTISLPLRPIVPANPRNSWRPTDRLRTTGR